MRSMRRHPWSLIESDTSGRVVPGPAEAVAVAPAAAVIRQALECLHSCVSDSFGLDGDLQLVEAAVWFDSR